MQSIQRGYKSFLLRLWQVEQDGRKVWRASLEDPHTGRRLAFASLAQLVEFLQKDPRNDDAPETGQPN